MWGVLSWFARYGRSFFPEDQSRFVISLQTPVGSSLAFTDSEVKQVEEFVRNRPEVERYFAILGSVVVTMKDPGRRGTDPVLHHELKQ